MGHKSSLQDFRTKHGVMCDALAGCIKAFHSNASIKFNILKGYSFHQVDFIVNQNLYSERFGGRVEGLKLHSQGTQVGNAAGRGAAAAAKAIVPMGVKMGIAAGVKAAKIPQNIPINIPQLAIPVILPAGVTVALAPIGAAIGPWIAAGTIMHKFRTVNNMSLLDLHDFYPRTKSSNCTHSSCLPAKSRGDWMVGDYGCS